MERIERPVSASRTTMSQVMLPEDANADANVHGGTIMKFADTAAAVAAIRHCRSRVVTARVDGMDFVAPVYVGDLVHVMASVNLAGKTSLEVGVRIEAEKIRLGEVRHVASAYFVFVALDDEGRVTTVPGLTPETDEDRRRLIDATHRQNARQEARRRARARTPGNEEG
ncbi:MAG TPA: acyl-CoA thioesterase [Chloroflexota bacterium]|nr:acyl-CoA thioesterase [Chloroflexota bacterium]